MSDFKREGRFALIYASSVEVLCPYCGANQPSPSNESDLWLPDEVRKHEGKRACVSCDKTMTVVPQPKAVVAK